MAKLDIAKLAVPYLKAITQNLLCIIHDRLVYLEPVTVSSNYLCRIFVPLSLRRVILLLYTLSLLQVIWTNTSLYIASTFVLFGIE